jgi:hypothetical protein
MAPKFSFNGFAASAVRNRKNVQNNSSTLFSAFSPRQRLVERISSRDFLNISFGKKIEKTNLIDVRKKYSAKKISVHSMKGSRTLLLS